MPDAPRTIHVVSTDETLLASIRSAARSLSIAVRPHATAEELFASGSPGPDRGDVTLLDGWLRGANVYETCRRLTQVARGRTYLVTESGNAQCEPIARFCGAAGVVERPLSESKLARMVAATESRSEKVLPIERRGRPSGEPVLPETLLVDLSGAADRTLVGALTDPQTSLFNFAFLNYKLDEEFKRAQRFGQPLSCVMLGFEGQAEEHVLRELSGLFLLASRDTDILGRFDENTFLFLLPNTPPSGAEVMAQRVAEAGGERGLRDLVGDELVLSVGISSYPHPDIERREDLFARAREAFFSARTDGGGVVTCT